jgi:hypothetical protein
MSMKEAWKPSPVVMRSLDLIAGTLYRELVIFYPIYQLITSYLVFHCSAEGITYREWAPGALVCSFFSSSNLITYHNTIQVPCFITRTITLPATKLLILNLIFFYLPNTFILSDLAASVIQN